MKNKKIRLFIVIALLLVVFIFLKQATNVTEGLNYPAYTSFSTGNEGTALLYDTLKIMGYPVGRDTMFIDGDKNTKNIQIVVEPKYEYYNSDYAESIAEWVAKGGKLLYFGEKSDYFAGLILGKYEPDSTTQMQGGSLHRIGLGHLYISYSADITNLNLMDKADTIGQPLADMINTFSYEKILFNEAYHGYNTDKGLFELLPEGIRLLAIQLVIVAICVVIVYGKRFGRPMPLYEEIEREENEYVHTLTNLYLSTGYGSVALDVYNNKFKKACANYFRGSLELNLEQILTLWQEADLPELDKVKYIKNAENTNFSTKRRKDKKEIIKIASYYRELIDIVSKLQ